jgi:RHS repeat-associated protein
VQDPETGLVYMQARYYQARGQFLSPDPVGPSPGNIFSFNRYAYANNNPVRFTDPDGRKCTTVDGTASCTFDEFKDKNGKTISREQAMSNGSKLAKFFHADRGSRIRRAEAAMTAKYSAAKDLAAKDGSITIKGNGKLGIPDQTVSGSAIVNHMETLKTVSAAGPSPDDRLGYKVLAGVPKTSDGSPSNGPMTFWSDGNGANVGRIFGHEILHTIYSGAGLPNRGWANPDFNEQHQVPFDEASDAIQ